MIAKNKTTRFFLIILMGFLFTMTSCKSSKKSVTEINQDVIGVVSGDLYDLNQKIVEEALSWVGTPYKYGASEKGKATDCSGMVLMVYETVAEKKLPRNSKKQAEFCKKLKKKNVKPGDLVFFAIGKDRGLISHVGIMVGDIEFVHASASKGVIVSEITTPYYEKNFVMFGRVPD